MQVIKAWPAKGLEIFNCGGTALNLSGWWLLYFKTYILKNVKQNILQAFFKILKSVTKGRRKKSYFLQVEKTPTHKQQKSPNNIIEHLPQNP